MERQAGKPAAQGTAALWALDEIWHSFYFFPSSAPFPAVKECFFRLNGETSLPLLPLGEDRLLWDLAMMSVSLAPASLR